MAVRPLQQGKCQFGLPQEEFESNCHDEVGKMSAAEVQWKRECDWGARVV